MRAIITVIGKDRKGIIAGVSTELAGAGINILDISQTIMQEYFVMIMLVDLTSATDDFDVIQEKLDRKGKELSVQVKMQREEIFQAMHQI
jgi:ACT domain-containing protein